MVQKEAWFKVVADDLSLERIVRDFRQDPNLDTLEPLIRSTLRAGKRDILRDEVNRAWPEVRWTPKIEYFDIEPDGSYVLDYVRDGRELRNAIMWAVSWIVNLELEETGAHPAFYREEGLPTWPRRSLGGERMREISVEVEPKYFPIVRRMVEAWKHDS